VGRLKWKLSRNRIITLLIVCCLVIGIVVFHIWRNQPFSTMGYWTQASNYLPSRGNHFSQNGVLEVQFHFKSNGVNTKESYSVFRVGAPNKPIVDSVSLGKETMRRGEWDMYRFSIAPDDKRLNLSVGEYIVTLYLNGNAAVSHTFYVDTPITIS